MNYREEAFWQAVVSRDVMFDGRFVFAVRTTGVYCRPSCPARRPRRENTVFFGACDEAEAAGYRPCKRCDPRAAAAPDAGAEIVRQAAALIDAGGTCRLNALSAELHVSPFHLQRTFKRVLGVTPRQYAQARRMSHMKTSLRSGANATEALYAAGFGSSSRAYAQADRLGMTPGAYGRGGRGMAIAYTLADSALGRILIAATQRGLCAAYIGDSDTELRLALFEEYPAAQIEERCADVLLMAWASALQDYLCGTQPYTSLSRLPLDVQGTAFQAQVWQALRDIPAGAVRTYGEVAEAIGQPAATRAVAQACAANRAAVLIPCHRVIRSDGGMGGYRWGVERKQRLLDQESRPASSQS